VNSKYYISQVLCTSNELNEGDI